MMPRTVPALALAAFLALGGFAAAADGGDDPASPDGSSGAGPNGTAPPDCARAKDPEACKAAYCREHADDARCAAAARDTSSKPGRPDPRAGKVDRLEHIEFSTDSPRQLSGFKVDGRVTLDRLVLDPGSDGRLATERRGDALVVGDADTRLRLHDNPVGLVEFKGADGGVLLGFPAGVQVATGERGHAARIHYPDGRDGLLVADAAAWSGRNVTLTGFFSFHVARSDPFEGEGPGSGELRSKLRAAVESRHLGAEVALERHPANASRAVQVLAYDDLAVQVRLPDTAAADAPIAVQLSANLTEGRTVVLHVDPALLGNATADRLDLHYYDDHADGSRTEAVFARAGSLADVLDPTDDGGRPEYWVVADADGLQVLVSVPHWSTHTVTLSGLGALLQPSVLAGALAGAAGIAVAAVALFWPRRSAP
ncbi:MAG: hypothetical protein LC623_07780 [Halobacteriales archaeon]|nr:hypothetical protein [Halobacteriales archaeon]